MCLLVSFNFIWKTSHRNGLKIQTLWYISKYQYINEQIQSLHFPSRLWLDLILDIKSDKKSIKVSLYFSSPIKKFYSLDNRWFKDIYSLLQILNMVIWRNLTISTLCLALSVLVQWPNFMCVITVSIIVS